MKNPLVSVVIPNYNNEKHLPECLESVINQTYKNLEIIVVNDGSTDGSIDIIKGYMSRDGRIKCIDQENTGLAVARKSGLDAATGEWVQHLDSDDFLELDGIEKLVARAEESGADIISSAFWTYSDDKKRTRSETVGFEEISGTDYFRKVMRAEVFWSMWSNFHKLSLYFDYNIKVFPRADFGEDAIFMTQMFLNNPKIARLNDCVVNYRQNAESISNSETARKKRISGQKWLQQWITNYILSLKLPDDFDYELSTIDLLTFGYCLSWKYFDDVENDIDKMIKIVEKYPELYNRVSRRGRKFIRYYRFSPIAGRLLLKHYRHKYGAAR